PVDRIVVHRVAGGGDRVVAVRPGGTAADSARVRPDVCGEIGMRVLDPAVGLADHDRSTPSRLVPGRDDVFVGARRAREAVYGLAGVLVPPLQAKGTVARTGSLVPINGTFVSDVVRFGVPDSSLGPEHADGGADLTRGHVEHVNADANGARVSS